MVNPNSNKPGRRGGRAKEAVGAAEEREKLDMRERMRKNFAGWKPNIFTIGVVISNNVISYAILASLMNFLTNHWHVSLPNAASIVNVLSGLAALSSIMWTFLGDAYFGRYRTVLFCTAFYVFGLGLLTTSPSQLLSKAENRCWTHSTDMGCIVSKAEAIVFYGSLFLIAVGMDGHEPVLKAFGADQFTAHNTEEKRAKNKLRIWWGSGLFVGMIVGLLVSYEVERKGSWLVGYGISSVVKLVALFLFVSGTKFYKQVEPSGSPLKNVLRVFVAAVRKGYLQHPVNSNQLYEKCNLNQEGNTECLPLTNRYRFLNKACIIESPHNLEEQENKWRLCTVTQVEQTKLLLDMLPIWLTFLMYSLVSSMGRTFFIQQASTMDRRLGIISKVPTSTLLGFSSGSANQIRLILKYMLKKNNLKIPPAISIGVGMFFATLCCSCASYFEAERLKVVKEHGLLDMPPGGFVPMSVFLLLPQFILLGAMDGFTSDSLESFFKDQVPVSMEKFGPSFSETVTGVGNLLCAILIIGSVKISERRGTRSWFADTINKSRLDYFYRALTVMVYINLWIYALVSRAYKKPSNQQEAGTHMADMQCV